MANEQADMIAMISTGKVRVNNTILPKTYTVQKGDTLYKIARRMYGDGDMWQILYEKNVERLSHPLLVAAGMVLYL